jgi:hypothetical protein
MLVCLIVLKCGSWVYEKFYSNKKHIIGGGSSGSDPLVIMTTNSRVTATTVVVVGFYIVLVLGYRHYRNWRVGLCKEAKVKVGSLLPLLESQPLLPAKR